MYAIIESCGKQYKVSKGDIIFFEKLDQEVGKDVNFDNVIFISDNGKVEVGNPYVKGAIVTGKVLAHGKGKKIIVFKMKAKKNYRRKQGHRQPYTKVEIVDIKMPSNSESKKETAKKETVKKETVKKETTKKETVKKEVAKKETTKKDTKKVSE